MSSKTVSVKRRQMLLLAVGTTLGAGPKRTLAATPSAHTLSLVGLRAGQTRSIPIGNYQVLVLHRDPHTIEQLRRNTGNLADPRSEHSKQPAYARNPWRSRDPAYLVVINHCTFEGCRTAFGGCPGNCGFSCPCCGSQYDAAGRVHKFQPAPRNLAIPYYQLDRNAGTVVVVRVEHAGAVA